MCYNFFNYFTDYTKGLVLWFTDWLEDKPEFINEVQHYEPAYEPTYESDTNNNSDKGDHGN